MQNSTKIKVGIVRGGVGQHYASSLKKGGEIIFHIFENLSDKYRPVDILIDKNNVWHYCGVSVNPQDLIHKVDIVWNVALPEVSMILENFSIPHISNNTFSEILENSRELLEEHMKNIDVKMPRRIVLPLYQKDFDGPKDKYIIKKAREIFEKFGAPWIVKSFTPDLNMGIHLAKTYEELINGIENGVNHQKSVLIEEFITGKAGCVYSVPMFRREDIYVFLPQNLSVDEKEKITSVIKNLHHHINAKHYLKSDFILHPRRGFFLTSIDLSPDLRDGSHFKQACESVGAKMHHVIEHILKNSLDSNKK